MVKPKMNVQNRFRCLDIVHKQAVVRVSLFWSIFEQSKNGYSMRVRASYPQKKLLRQLQLPKPTSCHWSHFVGGRKGRGCCMGRS
jgi:hypothetical protein